MLGLGLVSAPEATKSLTSVLHPCPQQDLTHLIFFASCAQDTILPAESGANVLLYRCVGRKLPRLPFMHLYSVAGPFGLLLA